jgi:hypothetical protein
MKEHPILFSTPMVQAILEGRKTMTRRVVKFPKDFDGKDVFLNGSIGLKYSRNDGTVQRLLCPYGQIGDKLWVREKFCLTQPFDPDTYYFGYADRGHSVEPASSKYDYSSPHEWKPSIHMPREACRILLENTNIRVEKLQDISEGDAINEGIEPKYSRIEQDPQVCYSYGASNGHVCSTATSAFELLWEKINGTGSWNKNPLVWVIEFKRV